MVYERMGVQNYISLIASAICVVTVKFHCKKRKKYSLLYYTKASPKYDRMERSDFFGFQGILCLSTCSFKSFIPFAQWPSTRLQYGHWHSARENYKKNTTCTSRWPLQVTFNRYPKLRLAVVGLVYVVIFSQLCD